MDIHVVIPFSRFYLKNRLIGFYKPMNIIMHPILFNDEITDFNEPWILPFIIPKTSPERDSFVGLHKLNYFISNAVIIDDDYYQVNSDLGMVEDNVFSEIKKMDEDVIIISLKRGYSIPSGIEQDRAYPTETLYAHPLDVRPGYIDGAQYIVKGSVFKKFLYNVKSRTSDGEIAVWLKDNYKLWYEPDLFALFHYFEEGRWDRTIDLRGIITKDTTLLLNNGMQINKWKLEDNITFLVDDTCMYNSIKELIGRSIMRGCNWNVKHQPKDGGLS